MNPISNLPSANPLKPEKVCGTCGHWTDRTLHLTLEVQGVCRCGPPTVIPVPQQIKGKVVMGRQSVLPITNETFYCHQWKVKLELV